MSVFSRELDKLMNAFDMSNEKLGELVGVNRTTVSRWRSGERSPKLEKLPEIAAVFNVDTRVFVGEDKISSIETIYNQLEPQRQAKVYDFASYQLKEQNRKTSIVVTIKGYVSAGTGEWLEETSEEVEFSGEVPEHDFAVRVNGNSMLPLFEDKQVIFVKGTSEARDGQIIVCRVNSDAYVKKLSGNKLVSLNKEYDDILISETDDFKIFGVVVL
ncbi:XRE family transcriptional regulator [Enterococcus faecium]|uniref:XRE family transcriptional regulator n=1 Tax=Enterococcus faecium TaxID=1352 RepID=UPI00288F1DFF|nr:XRE family transcriptional regulator [Enterococcus faecium]MDT2371847.1 XRE family transcriptional regulator [Enterococcus faecium]